MSTEKTAFPETRQSAVGLKQGALGATSIAFLVIAAAAPLTVMAGVAPLSIAIGGIGAPVAYLGAGIVFAVFAVGFVAMVKQTGGGGAFYSYITLGLGRKIGLASGFLALLAYNGLQIGFYGLLATQIQAAIINFTGVNIPWPVIGVASALLVWLIGRRGIELGANLLGVLLIAETAILLLLAIAVVAQGGASGLHAGSFSPGAVFSPGMGAVLAIGLGAFAGFESTALYRSEARNPNRTIPRATYWAVGFMAVFYCFIVWAAIQAFGEAAAQQEASKDVAGLFFQAIDMYVGPWAGTVMYVLVITSAFASQIAFHNAINRYTYTLANDSLLPKRLGTAHPKFSSPAAAGSLQSILAIFFIVAFAVAGADPYFQFLVWVNTPGGIGIILLQLLMSAAVVSFFVRRKRAPGSLIPAVFGVISTVLLSVALTTLIVNLGNLTNTTGEVNAILVGIVPTVLIAGIVTAFILKARRPHVYQGIGGTMGDGTHAEVSEPEPGEVSDFNKSLQTERSE
ncbi:APC family permease [Arthrobacter sp. KNU-44]|uniref:APC family permease n=1 Tax=Arthrobacter sp. KNU-44 TaxID=3450744 RepID=UPI003F439740